MTRGTSQEAATATIHRHRWHSAASYDEATSRVQRRNAALVAGLHPGPETVHRALDLGCGTGALTEELLGRLPAARVTALDVSADMLARARARTAGRAADRVEFRLGSFLDPVVFPDRPENTTAADGTDTAGERFDAVFSNAAIHWMYPRYDDCFARVRRLLLPGGLLCAASAGRSAATDAFDRRVGAATARVLPPATGDDFTRRRMYADDVVAVARRTGLTVDDVFLVERRSVVSVAAYATWWLASGGPWQADPPQEERAVELLAGALGGPDADLEMVHASVFAVLRRPS